MRTGRITKLLFTFVFLFSLLNVNATAQKKPDFAYPKTVSLQAEKALTSALDKSDGAAITRALIDYYLAETRISRSKAYNAIKKINDICDRSSDSVLKAMLLTLEADIYADIYQRDKWKYDSRTLPSTPLSDDFNEWNGLQFRKHIMSLLDSALVFAPELKKTPISNYSSVLDIDGKINGLPHRNVILYYPTLFDFVTNKAIEILNSTNRIQPILPWRILSSHDIYVRQQLSPSDPIAAKIIQLYSSLLNFHDAKSAPFINTDISRLDFLSSHIYSYDSTESPEKRKWDLLRDLYNDNSGSEYSGDILIAMSDYVNDPKWLYNAISHNISAFPAYPRSNNLRNTLSRLSQQTISASYPFMTAPGTPVKINVETRNVQSGKIYIYNVSSTSLTEQSYNCKGLPKFKPTAVLPFKAKNETIPFSDELIVEYNFPSKGLYIVIPVIDGVVTNENRWYQKIHVTDYTLAASSFDKTTLWALDAMTGAPVEGAKITMTSGPRMPKPIVQTLGLTSADGSLKCDKTGRVWMVKNDDKFAPTLWVYTNEYNKPDTKWQPSASGYSSLPLYHPGDSVDWVAVCYEFKGKEHRPRIGQEITAILRDASYQPIDTINLTTDTFGRVNGKFILPKESLGGRFTVSIDNYSEAVNFEVSDYKLPTFRIFLDPAQKDQPSDGDITLRGRVETYTGFPIADAKLTINLSAMQPKKWWWIAQEKVNFYTIESTTDASGMIEVTIPKDILALSPIPKGVFNADISAMSPNGESQSASVDFTTENRYIIRLSMPDNIDISEPTMAIKAKIVNYMDSIVALPLDYCVIHDSTEVLKGVLLPSQTSIDLSPLHSGKYKIKFSLKDSDMADPIAYDVVLYRPTDTDTPIPGTLLWYPSDKLSITEDRPSAWLYAVDCPTNLLVTIHDGLKIISRTWIKSDAGMHTLPLNLPDYLDSAVAEINLTGNYRTSSARIELKREKKAKGLKFITETFRDRITPGTEETWTFRVIDETSKGRKAAVMLDMYNTAINALAKQDWSLKPYNQNFNYYFSWNQPNPDGKEYTRIFHTPNKHFTDVTLTLPEFNTYGLKFYASNIDEIKNLSAIKVRGSALMSKSAATGNNLSIVREHSDEIAVEEMATVENMNMADSDSGISVDPESGINEENTTTETSFSFRDREVALAFFKPMLTTDENGNLSLTFSVPNANATWNLKAIAYTDSLLSTSFATDVTASKAVMVQPNLPRFLRAGDKAEIIASVMNNSDKAQFIETRIELFNASDGKVFKEYTRKDSVSTKSAIETSIILNAPSDIQFIGYRIKSSTDRYADGEQSLIPVLEAVSPIIDTYPFYIAPQTTDFSMELPAVLQSSRVTLQFCENPTWYVVTALPGLLDNQASTANEAAASIFSAAIASGLLHDNPAIAKAIKYWTDSDHSDSTLKSMLESNNDLKQMLLASTPWMSDANNDRERMTRLALLFDDKTVGSTIKANIKTLRKLVRDNGGWAWYGSSTESSRWATENVLLLMGRLYKSGYLPQNDDLRSMITSAIKWIDFETQQDYRNNPEQDYTRYIYIHDFYKGLKSVPTANPAIVSTMTQRILTSWKSATVFNKAIYASILASNSYPSVAKTILTSLREYAEYTPTKGMWWPSLDNMTNWSMSKIGATATILEAFAEIDPGCIDIDRIRQWLILQKEAQNWGTSVTSTTAIAAILSTSSKWIEGSETAVVSVNGIEIKPSETEKLTGYFRTPISLSENKNSKLNITRKNGTPSWGSVFYLHKDSITSIKAASCPEISIEKVLVTTIGNGSPTTSYADSLKLGQKLSVTLTLHVDRDMDYVTIIDERPACYEPVEQLPKPIFAEGIYFYRENRDSSTRLFIEHLPKGVYVLSYDVWINNAGTYASGIATVQSQYAPQFTAHTSGERINVK